jgi:glycosyltransferase involved in cell wall biosynthesis
VAVARLTHLVITTDSVGGIWRYCIDLAEELGQRGVEVTIAGLGPPPSVAQGEEARAAGAELIWLDAPLDWASSGEEGAKEGAAALDRLLRARRPDLLHLNAPALAPFLTINLPRLVVAHSCLGTWWDTMREEVLPPEWQVHRRMMAAGLRAADLVITPTAAFAEALQRVYGNLPPIHVVPNGCRPIAPAAEKGEFVFTAGRWWDEAKNLKCLDAVAQELAWPLKAAGPLSGPQGSAVQAQHVDSLGSLSHREIVQWLGRAPIFVSPARYEPFGLAVLEAASAGAALVLSAIPTFRELWGDCAILIDPQQPRAWAQAVNRLIGEPERRQELGQRAQRRSADFTLPRQAVRMLGAYRKAIAGRVQTA